MTCPDSALLSGIKSLQASPHNMRPILEELSLILHGDRSWSRAEIFRAGEIMLDGKIVINRKETPYANRTGRKDKIGLRSLRQR